jgi:hypothetical protein
MDFKFAIANGNSWQKESNKISLQEQDTGNVFDQVEALESEMNDEWSCSSGPMGRAHK